MPVTPADVEFLIFLTVDCDYEAARIMPGGRWAAVAWTTFGCGRIVGGVIGDRSGVDLGYCYETMGTAVAAMAEWSGDAGTEPTGWVRAFGLDGVGFRRRPDGDPAREYVTP